MKCKTRLSCCLDWALTMKVSLPCPPVYLCLSRKILCTPRAAHFSPQHLLLSVTSPSGPPSFPLCLRTSCLLRDFPHLSLSRVQFFAAPWTAARQVSLSITNSHSLLYAFLQTPLLCWGFPQTVLLCLTAPVSHTLLSKSKERKSTEREIGAKRERENHRERKRLHSGQEHSSPKS